MKKKWLAAIIVYIAMVTVCIVIVYVVPSLRGMLEKTYVTEFGRIDITDEVSGFIVRDETVYVADKDSKIDRLADTDVLLKSGTQIVELTPDESADQEKQDGAVDSERIGEQNNISHKYADIIKALEGNVSVTDNGRTHVAGYVSYNVDGTETRFGTDRLFELKQKDLESLKDIKSVQVPERSCGKGEPVFKIIHNSKWYLVFYIDNKTGEKYYEGRDVSIRIGDRDVPVEVAWVEVGKKTTKVALSCKEFYEGFADVRTLDTTVTAASAEGLVLRDSSIVKKGEQVGVFVKNKLGEHVFKPVLIKADDGERCVVYSDIYVDENGNFVETIKTYDEIVTAPDEEEVAELQKQLKREQAEEAARKAEEEKAAAERAEAEKAANERAKQRAEAEKAALEKSTAQQNQGTGGAQTQQTENQQTQPSQVESEDAVGIPEEDGSGEYTEDVSSQEADTD